MRLNQQHHNISIRRATPSGGDHGAVQATTWLKQARRVDKNDLRRALHRHPTNTRAGGLHLMGDNRYLGTHHAVQQGRFTCVGLSDKSHKSGPCVRAHLFILHLRQQSAGRGLFSGAF